MKYGHAFHVDVGEQGQSFVSWATPVVIGGTGSAALRLDDQDRFHAIPSPGADENRNVMLRQVQEAGLNSLVGLFADQNFNLDALTRKLRTKDAWREAFGKWDANGDGSVSPSEIASTSTSNNLTSNRNELLKAAKRVSADSLNRPPQSFFPSDIVPPDV